MYLRTIYLRSLKMQNLKVECHLCNKGKTKVLTVIQLLSSDMSSVSFRVL